jgi:hypothetical protein
MFRELTARSHRRLQLLALDPAAVLVVGVLAVAIRRANTRQRAPPPWNTLMPTVTLRRMIRAGGAGQPSFQLSMSFGSSRNASCGVSGRIMRKWR